MHYIISALVLMTISQSQLQASQMARTKHKLDESSSSSPTISRKNKRQAQSADQYDGSLDKLVVIAAQSGDLAPLRALVDNESEDPNRLLNAAVSKFGFMALMLAITSRHNKVIEFFMGIPSIAEKINGMDYRYIQGSETYITPLMATIEGRNLEAVVILLRVPGININATSLNYNYTALMIAILQYYKFKQLSITSGCNSYEQTISQCFAIIQELLAQKSLNVSTPKGFTPLMQACHSKLSEVVHVLIEKGADVHAKHKDDTAFDFAALPIEEIKTFPEDVKNHLQYLQITTMVVLLCNGATTTNEVKNSPELTQAHKECKAWSAKVFANAISKDFPLDLGRIIADYLTAFPTFSEN